MAVFQEMELNNVQPDSVACAALMRAFNRGSQPGKALLLAELMREKDIPYIDAVLFEMVSACTMYVPRPQNTHWVYYDITVPRNLALYFLLKLARVEDLN